MVYTGIENTGIEKIKDAYRMPHWGVYAGKTGSDIGAVVDGMAADLKKPRYNGSNSLVLQYGVSQYDNGGIPF